MTQDTITKKDLMQLKEDIMIEISELILKKSIPRKWIRTKEALAMLNISKGTLQNLRKSGIIKTVKFGKALYYSIEQIDQMFNTNSANNIP